MNLIGKKVIINKKEYSDSNYLNKMGIITAYFGGSNTGIFVKWPDGKQFDYYFRQITIIDYEPIDILKEIL